ncbi:hypothetical protein AMS68_005963 [Peltaster fructicola]|uniref:K Homology domain-containing protein n=1 Tax=Peltaster fructicola TaxID=286661 RepID=A0A6H0Y0J0_9PEZI|nr:hypothetical protein AMS68_005963 [Peltaster fructicola]
MAEPRSPLESTAPSQKRPLEEPSSPSGPTDGPHAKRPALDKVQQESEKQELTQDPTIQAEESQKTALPDIPQPVVASTSDVPAVSSSISNPEASLPAIVTSNGSAPAAIDTPGAGTPYHNQDESNWLHLRAIISSAEAATVIGKGGENVTQIRRLAGAKCTVSEYSRGAVERILTVSGPVDAVAKAFGLIIRTLNQESLEDASSPHSKTYPLRLLIPHILIGSIIGKGGVRIREIQEASGARLNASESCLPLSTERSLVVLGVADAVHIATYYVGRTLVEQLTERFGSPGASAYATRHGGAHAGAMPGGMQVAPYVPMPAGGQVGGPPDPYRKHAVPAARGPAAAPYAAPYMGHPQHAQAPMPYNAGSPRGPYVNTAQPYVQPPQQPMHPATPQQAVQTPAAYGQPITQQIYIPNDMVGAIIGKGGAKINEIRTLSGSVIKINEPQDNSNERLVTVTGTSECNQMALYMLYSRLGESSKNSNATMPR